MNGNETVTISLVMSSLVLGEKEVDKIELQLGEILPNLGD
jgi:hypothetical protein